MAAQIYCTFRISTVHKSFFSAIPTIHEAALRVIIDTWFVVSCWERTQKAQRRWQLSLRLGSNCQHSASHPYPIRTIASWHRGHIFSLHHRGAIQLWGRMGSDVVGGVGGGDVNAKNSLGGFCESEIKLNDSALKYLLMDVYSMLSRSLHVTSYWHFLAIRDRHFSQLETSDHIDLGGNQFFSQLSLSLPHKPLNTWNILWYIFTQLVTRIYDKHIQ